MNNLSKVTSTAATTTATTPSTDGVPATTTTSRQSNSNQSAMTTITTPSSDQSIEEEIEEIIETSVDDEDDDDDVANGTTAKSLDLAAVAPIKLEHTQGAKKIPFDLFGIDLDESESALEQKKASSKQSSSDDDEFKIDDDQLSGGKLAQHFILADDDDDEDDNDDDFDISLPIEKRIEQHSRHETHSEEAKDESLNEQSTANDISDFVEEQPNTATTSETVQQVAAETMQVVTESTVEKLQSSLVQAISSADASQERKQTKSVVDVLLDASPEHSELDHSIEEIVESNHSIEITFDDKDISSLNPSFLQQNESFINRLLNVTSAAETSENINKQMEESAEKSLKNIEVQAVVKQSEAKCEATVKAAANLSHPTKGEMSADTVEAFTVDTSRIVTDLDDTTNDRVDSIHMPLKEAKIIDNKSATIYETIQLQETEATKLATTKLQPKIDLTVENTNEASNTDISAIKSVESKDNVSDDEEENSLELMKLRVLAMKLQAKEQAVLAANETSNGMLVPVVTTAELAVKQMERVPINEFNKDVLEDITEESERNSLSTAEEQQSISLEKSLTMTPKSESKTLHADAELESSNSIVSLNMIKMLENKVGELQNMLASKDACLTSLNLQLENAHRRESSGAMSVEQPGSGRDSSSCVTNSTEYRTFQEDFGGPTMDMYMELSKRDELIAKLTDSLQQSLTVRENLQSESEKLTMEVQLLRKQLAEAMDTLRQPCWPRDQESNGGQRISEITMDLISESDDDLERQFLTDNEDKYSRNSRERQLSIPRQFDELESADWSQAAFSKQIEQFQKYLTPSEVRLFFMVQKKFDDFLSQELEKCKMKCELEWKVQLDQYESEKLEKDNEIKRLQNLRVEKDNLHAKEMEDLRKYFETKCADLEKQFSDDVFSQKSQRIGLESSGASECSDQEQIMPEEVAPLSTVLAAVTRSKESSPRKRTRAELLLSPSHRQLTPCADVFSKDAKDDNLSLEVTELKSFYQNKIRELQRLHEEQLRKLSERLKYYESRYPDDDFMTLLSETTTDDHHWPSELILLREKFTAKSQLEIAQLQIKHEEEMSRLKLDYEKQLNRKNKRNLTFDSGRDFDQIISERDGLRELSKVFRHVLAELAKCVANCEDDVNATIIEEMQNFLTSNKRSLEAPTKTLVASQSNQNQEHELALNLNVSLLNASFNTTKQLRFVPDVQSLLELIEDPNLMLFISQKGNDLLSDNFDLNDCLDRLKSEAVYLLELSEEQNKHRKRLMSDSSGAEKNDSCCEEEDGLKISSYQPMHKYLRTNSLNEQQLGAYHDLKTQQQGQLLTSLPPDLNRLRGQHTNECSSIDGNASELNFQVHELKNRLVKSETDRLKLQTELEHTIARNTELGQELQTLRDQVSQLNSLNHTDYAEGYGLGSLKSPQRLSVSDKSSSNFAQLQEKARNILSTPTQQQSNNDATVALLQMIEDFCREGDKVVECNKKDREDLQLQIDTADKQLKATRQFLEEQAAEREQERDEYVREIDCLKVQLRDKEKERTTFENASKEVEQLEAQLRDLTQKLNESHAKRDKFEAELKASIDKIFVLREIISELEGQVETKALNEHVFSEKVKQLEEYIHSQTRSNETLQSEVQSLKIEIDEGYQERIRVLEEKLQNIRPSAEQSMVMDHVVEQLRDIETTLEQKTKTLEVIHNSVSSNSCSEDISVHGSRPTSLPTTILTTPQGSPVHPSPRQHSLTMESVQRVMDKLSKHTRAEEAAIKRIRDLEMQVTQMRSACVELQHERDALQDRMSEQTQRISALQSRLEEQRQRAEELNRAGTADLNIRLHDAQTDLQNVRETLSAREKQITTMKQQLEKSKLAIDRLEAELAIERQPDRSIVERLETELKQKCTEVQRLKDKIKSEMINKLALPDLMETMLADKNEEIDHLKEQLESKERELQTALDMSQGSSIGGGAGKAAAVAKDDTSNKLSARTLSDIVSITEFDEPDVVRRAVPNNLNTPLLLPEGSSGFMQQTMETSKEAVANLTQKRTDDLSGFANLRPANTFDNPHYFQDPNVLMASGKSTATATPTLVPRQINFSDLTQDSKVKTPNMLETPDNAEVRTANVENLEKEVAVLRRKLKDLQLQKEEIKVKKEQEIHAMEEDLIATQLRLGGLQEELTERKQEIKELREECESSKNLQKEFSQKSLESEQLLMQLEKLTAENKEKSELLTKNEKNLRNNQEHTEKHLQRIKELETKVLDTTVKEVQERESLRKELQSLSETHEQCKFMQKDAEKRKIEIEQLNQDVKAKDERLLALTTKLSLADENVKELQQKITVLEREIEKLRQQNSDNSSKQFSVDEIAQQVEKELNYSAQLDSNILKAIESEEENNLDVKHLSKEKQVKTEPREGTDDENFTGERELLNQVEILKAQVASEREQSEEIRKELLAVKQHSQLIQEQDVGIIEAMHKRLEIALSKEDDLHKQLDMERERCDRLQTQLTALQRAESRRNSALLLKSPTESPRKSPRSFSDFELELAERLRSEIKMLTAQNERERERLVDLQRSSERERQRYDNELQERVEYCEKLKKEMDKLAREKDNAEHDIEHLQERLTLQTQEIESLEARLATLQEAETRRSTRRERQQKETTELLAEIQELKSKLLSADTERESLNKTITHLRYDVERSAQREAQLAEALANANVNLTNATENSVPQQFMQKMKEINQLLAENTQENRQMAESVQYLVEERRQLQKKCEELEAQLGGSATVTELEERCNHLLGRYLRVESHRKALVYQKRYLKISLQSYQDSEQRALAAIHGADVLQPQHNKKKLFKTVALAIIAIQRMKYIGRIWHTGKRIVSKSVFTITQQRRSQAPTISTQAAVSSTSPTSNLMQHTPLHGQSPYKLLERNLTPLQTPALLNEFAGVATNFDWSRAHAHQE